MIQGCKGLGVEKANFPLSPLVTNPLLQRGGVSFRLAKLCQWKNHSKSMKC